MTTQTIDMPNIAESSRATPLVRELPADLETPVSVYLKLAGEHPSFLLESVTGGEQVARYSFIGVNPSRAYVFQGQQVAEYIFREGARSIERTPLNTGQNPLDYLRGVLGERCDSFLPDMPRFNGGLVGYLGYEIARHFEASLPLRSHAELPDAIFLLADVVVAFDHAFGRLLLIGNPCTDEEISNLDQVSERLDQIERRLSVPLPQGSTGAGNGASEMASNFSKPQFCEAVQAAKEHIAAGDIFQVVLSQRLSRETEAAPFDIYRTLRRLNPSPYMFYFDFADLAGPQPLRLIGASPEMHVRLEGNRATVRPIAGTRKRGKTTEEQAELERDLMADPKERAEHIMLVDLGRNDLGRICKYGSVQVTEQMGVERYSHVIHLVSNVEGELSPEYDAFDLLRATFPAGTVSGAPKIRAMQIIHDLEFEPRGPYAGAVGYFSYDGSMDTCIAIRTLVMQGNRVHLQAGAGIVADSVPEKEYEETLSKLKALAVAIDLAEGKDVTR